MVVKTKDEVLSYPTVETVQEDSICKLVYAPARNVSEAINRKAQELARKAVSAFEGKGVFGVEMFLLEDDSLLLCEIASRIHNSGHYTIEGCPMSQFEAHIRAILDLPIPPQSLQIRQPSIMLNIIGGSAPDTHLKAAEAALSIPNASIHLYSKGAAKPGRKMGHVTVTAPTMHEAESHIQPLIDVVDDIRSQRSDVRSKPQKSGVSKPAPSVAVIMGSDSDLKTLVPGLKLLRDYFGVEPDVEITSAHRTPTYMAEYSANAAARGIKVIIAAAGGAAHLPGMSAAHTALPVIGVPVKGSSLDGVDSLYSIVQMPRGESLPSFPFPLPFPIRYLSHVILLHVCMHTCTYYDSYTHSLLHIIKTRLHYIKADNMFSFHRCPRRHRRHQQQHQCCPPGRPYPRCFRPGYPAQG